MSEDFFEEDSEETYKEEDLKEIAKTKITHGMTIAMNAAGMGMTTVLTKTGNWCATALPVHLAAMMSRNKND